MESNEMPEPFENMTDIAERMEYLLRWGGTMTGSDLAMEIRNGLFENSSFLLLLLLLSLDDRAVVRVRNRLFLQLLQKACEQESEEEVVTQIGRMLEEEAAVIEGKRQKCR